MLPAPAQATAADADRKPPGFAGPICLNWLEHVHDCPQNNLGTCWPQHMPRACTVKPHMVSLFSLLFFTFASSAAIGVFLRIFFHFLIAVEAEALWVLNKSGERRTMHVHGRHAVRASRCKKLGDHDPVIDLIEPLRCTDLTDRVGLPLPFDFCDLSSASSACAPAQLQCVGVKARAYPVRRVATCCFWACHHATTRGEKACVHV